MDQSSVGLIAAGCGLLGVLIGQFLSRSWQREQWRLDNEKQEAQELLTALHKLVPAYTLYERTSMNYVASFADGAGDNRAKVRSDYNDATVEFNRVLGDRIFIDADVRRLNIKLLWDCACAIHEEEPNEQRLVSDAHTISSMIVTMVLENHAPLWKRLWRKMKRPRRSAKSLVNSGSHQNH